jgi:hypothetical protein
MKKDLEFYIPHNLNMRKILLQEGAGPRYIDCQIDKYHWFLHSLYIRSILNKKYFVGDFIPMNRRYMEGILGSDYVTDIIHTLTDHGIIECDDIYDYNVKSLGYRLTEKYMVRHVAILEDSKTTFIKNLINLEAKLVMKMDAITRYTYNQLQNIGIYREAAEAWVEEWYQKNIQVTCPVLMLKLDKQNKKRQRAERKARDIGKDHSYPALNYNQMLDIMKDAYLYQIKCIDEKLWLPKRDNKGRRIHSYIANMLKLLRQFLYLKNSPSTQLVALDCSNSQPYTLVKILLEYFKGQEIPADVQDYISKVCTGNLYHFMCDALGIIQQEQRDEFKTSMFSKVFYCPNEKSFHTPEAQKFILYFSRVYQVVMHEKKYNYKKLSIEMQRVETAAVIDGALTFLANKYGDDVFFASIHDSIVCPVEYQDEVREVMLKYYTKVVGVAPHIKKSEKINKVMVEYKKAA